MKTAYDYTREFISVLTEIDEKLELKSNNEMGLDIGGCVSSIANG